MRFSSTLVETLHCITVGFARVCRNEYVCNFYTVRRCKKSHETHMKSPKEYLRPSDGSSGSDPISPGHQSLRCSSRVWSSELLETQNDADISGIAKKFMT